MTAIDSRKTEIRRSGKSKSKLLKRVRRIHMYTGLLLLPWVILFGFSGMLFNHPELFGPVEVLTTVSATELDARELFEKPDPNRIANEVLMKINAVSGLGLNRVAPGNAVIEGSLIYQSPAKGGRAMVVFSPNSGSASVRQYPESSGGGNAQFPRSLEGTLNSYDSKGAAGAAARIFEDLGIEVHGAIEPVERGAAEVRFRVRSEAGRKLWNVSHNLVTGALSVRETTASPRLDLYSILTQLHKTHHYPDRFSARWLWTAFGDATGLTMVFWGISGLMMWWQIKPTRVIGVVSLSIAAVIAFVIFTGTLSHNNWVPRQAKGGPAGGGKATSKTVRAEAAGSAELKKATPQFSKRPTR